ncbi:CDP-alcohol phosphatidyltransferase family protein [Urechidicola sp. KH5]
MKRHIPNLFTLGNLLAGCIGAVYAANGELIVAGLFILLGIFLDFFDGFFARILNVPSELGKQLDSLADMVTSGVVPGLILVMLLDEVIGIATATGQFELNLFEVVEPLSYIGFLFTLGACYRLANFNIDTRQSTSFIGLPAPAAALVVVSLPLILEHSEITWLHELLMNQWILITITVLLTYLMNAEIPLFSLKFKSLDWSSNKIKYVFLIATLLLIIMLRVVSIPLIIISYVVLSLIENATNKVT